MSSNINLIGLNCQTFVNTLPPTLLPHGVTNSNCCGYNTTISSQSHIKKAIKEIKCDANKKIESISLYDSGKIIPITKLQELFSLSSKVISRRSLAGLESDKPFIDRRQWNDGNGSGMTGFKRPKRSLAGLASNKPFIARRQEPEPEPGPGEAPGDSGHRWNDGNGHGMTGF